jgi:hypothetical protein
MCSKNFRDTHSGCLLDFEIGIGKWQSEARGQPTADRRLARAHHANKHNGASPQSLSEAGRLFLSLQIAVHYRRSGIQLFLAGRDPKRHPLRTPQECRGLTKA